MTKVIAIANQKGGVGKTSTTVNLGAGLVRKGYDVLLIDLDSQANLTMALGYQNPDDMEFTISNVLHKAVQEEDIDPVEGILTTSEGIDLMPANVQLSGLEISLINEYGRENMLKQYIDEVRLNYDYILIDCAPSLSVLTVNALVAADSVLIPTQPHYFSMAGLQMFYDTICKIRSTMKKIKQIAEQIMRIAVDSDLILKNPFSGVKVPSIEPEMRRALTESEIDLITENWRGTRMGPAAMIMLYAGLRIGEVLALEWADIDFEKRTITVSKARAVYKNQASIKAPKTKAGVRVVPIPETLFNVLIEVKKKQGLVCPSMNGKLMSKSALKSAWKTFINHLNECAGGIKGTGPSQKTVMVIDHITAHMLRHTYATMLFDAGVDVKSAQKFLGHSDIEVTLEIYTHLSKFKEEQAIRALDEHLKERKKEPEICLLRVL